LCQSGGTEITRLINGFTSELCGTPIGGGLEQFEALLILEQHPTVALAILGHGGVLLDGRTLFRIAKRISCVAREKADEKISE